MTDTQILTIVLSTVPTMLTVLIGILVNNARLSDVRSSMSDVQMRLMNLEAKFDTRFDLLLSKAQGC